MLDHQGEAFAGEERLAAMTLGLAAASERVVVLLAIRRAEKPTPTARAVPHPLALALLGVVSLRRTLWGTLAVQPRTTTAAAKAPEPDGAAQADLSTDLPRGLLR